MRFYLKTKCSGFPIAALLLCATLLNAQSLPQYELPDEFYGISLGLHSQDASFDYTPMVDEIAETGADAIALNFVFYQDNIHSNSIALPKPSHLFWQQLRHTIRAAKKRQMKVFLSPILQLRNPGPGDWRGTINPQDKRIWFRQYYTLITAIALLAEEEQADMLSIGSELTALQSLDTYWSEIIKGVRSIFGGMLCYSINWDAIEDRPFIRELDMLGISAYFPLSEYANPSVRRLEKSWSKIQKELDQSFEHLLIPYFFSELGYRSVRGANMSPWDHRSSNQAVDITEQYNCYQAFISNYKNQQTAAGVFFYDWFGQGGLKDKGYTPKGKPALDLIKQFFAERHKKNRTIHNIKDNH
jgi:hypothetical protein